MSGREPEEDFGGQVTPHLRIHSPVAVNPTEPGIRSLRYRIAGKLVGRRVLIAGGEVGIGRAVAVLFGREGADLAITHCAEHLDEAIDTQRRVAGLGRSCYLLESDLSDPAHCHAAVEHAVRLLGSIDVLVVNAPDVLGRHLATAAAGEHQGSPFTNNVEACFCLARCAVPAMAPGGAIVIAGSESVLNEAIEPLTQRLADHFKTKEIRVNSVALMPDAHRADGSVESAAFDEMAPAFVFLASSADSRLISGAVLHYARSPIAH